MMVKFGTPISVKLEEAQIMRDIRQQFPYQELPAPRVFGWKVDQSQNFVYMSLMRKWVITCSDRKALNP
ncbi:hypothetical protein BJ170DRAFT_639726 [Xylariales sp. AK1849]|nr:hypothetical protein BJ170DRAFT_639726 [Xylariales sp. AK1849]